LETETPVPDRKRIIIVGGSPSDAILLRIAELATQHDAVIEYQELKEGEKDHVIAVGFNPNPPKVTFPFTMTPYLSMMDDMRPYMYQDFSLNVHDGKPHSKYARSATQAELDAPKVGRNEPCHCGSGVKFKKCHGK